MNPSKYILALLFFLNGITSQAQLYIGTGTTLKVVDAGDLTLQEINLQNEGIVEVDLATLTFKEVSATGNIIISGTGSTLLKHLTMDLQNQNLQLNQDLEIEGNLNFGNGLLDLNGNFISLGTGALLVGESETSRVVGSSGGEIMITLDLNIPSNANPGNLGAEITSAIDLGSTTISRGHVPYSLAGDPSMERYFDISPTTGSGLDATLRFHYLESELNGYDESELALFQDPGSGWEYMGFTTQNSTDNWVELTNINSFSTWTLGTQFSPLPVELTFFNVEKQNKYDALLNWETASEINSSHFEVERSVDGVQWDFVEKVEAAGSSNLTHQYQLLDEKIGRNFKTVYYRLKMVDTDYSFEYSEIRVVQFETHQWNIFPNPSIEGVFLEMPPEAQKIPIGFSIYDVVGKLILEETEKKVDSGRLWLKYPQQMVPGTYHLKVSSNGAVLFAKTLVVHNTP